LAESGFAETAGDATAAVATAGASSGVSPDILNASTQVVLR
jgi:hypothetical protein